MNGALVTLRTIGSLVAVLGLLGLFVWALRRGSLKLTSLAPKGTIAIETAMSLGERRSIAIVGVDGRRLLIGLTPTTISFLSDLTPKTAAPPSIAARSASASSSNLRPILSAIITPQRISPPPTTIGKTLGPTCCPGTGGSCEPPQ